MLTDLSLFVRIGRDEHSREGHLEQDFVFVLVAEDLEMDLFFKCLLGKENFHTRLILGIVVDVHLVHKKMVYQSTIRSLVRWMRSKPVKTHVFLHKIGEYHESKLKSKVRLNLLGDCKVLPSNVKDHLYKLLATEATCAIKLISED